MGIHESSGALIPGLVELLGEFRPEFFAPGKVPPHFPVHIEGAVSMGLELAEGSVREELADFLSSMQRRIERDIQNTREYYDALGQEMKASLSHPNLTEAQRQERSAEIEDLPLEMVRKIEDLEQKYQVRVTVSACGALRLLVDVAQLQVELKYRKFQRSLKVLWNPVTRRLDPLVCERCHGTMPRVHPAADNGGIRLRCPACAQVRG